MKKIPLYKYIFGISDVFVLFSAFIMSMYLVRHDPTMGFIEFTDAAQSLILIFLILSIVFIGVFYYNGLYRINIILTRAAHLTHIMRALYYGALNIVLVSLLIESSQIIDSRILIFVFTLFALPLLYVVRTELMRRLYLYFSKTGFRRNILILGDGKAGRLLATKLMYENPIGLNIVGFVDDDIEIGEEIVAEKRVIGRFDDLKYLVNQLYVDEILVAIDDEDNEKILEILDLCKELDVSVRITSEMFSIVAKKVSTEEYVNIPVIDVSSHYNNAFTLALKRFFDMVISISALIFFAPLMFLISALIKLSSTGPILFKQTRIGKNRSEERRVGKECRSRWSPYH